MQAIANLILRSGLWSKAQEKLVSTLQVHAKSFSYKHFFIYLYKLQLLKTFFAAFMMTPLGLFGKLIPDRNPRGWTKKLN